MRIEPAQISGPLENGSNADGRNLPRRASPAAAENGPPDAPTVVRPDKNQMQSAPHKQPQQLSLPQFPQDEVEVQFDKPMNDDILIYQFLDKRSGNLVMQLPSTQVLSVIHEIQDELQQNVSGQSGEQAEEIKRGGAGHGN
jgi:hypothetical protein